MNEKLDNFEKFLKNNFGNNFLIVSNRFLPFISGIYKDFNFFNLNSIKVYILGEINGKKYYYPNGNIKIEYEKLLKLGLIIDLIICNKKDFLYLKNKSYFFNGYYVYINKLKKDIEFSKGGSFNDFMNHIQSDNDNIDFNINNNLYEYKEYISMLKFISDKNKYNFLLETIELFIKPKIKSLKNKIKFYKKLQNDGYKTLNEFFSGKKINICSINYYKNILVEKEKYFGEIHKVYNIISSNKMKKGKIMIAENTNPEFIKAFYNASFICVETSSELSHAAITCKELKIPLALGAKNVFLASKDGGNININTKNRIINL